LGSKRTLTEPEIREQPHLVWNAFVDLLAMTRHDDDLEPRQLSAHLAFWYESEIQNGGHFQYFENYGLAQAEETVISLRQLGAESQASVLARALSVASRHGWGEISTVEEFVAQALDSELSGFDSEFHACAPSVDAVLETHLLAHQDWYIEVRAG
jgi:hypothetical protein